MIIENFYEDVETVSSKNSAFFAVNRKIPENSGERIFMKAHARCNSADKWCDMPFL
jgi:hypothetical protein